MEDSDNSNKIQYLDTKYVHLTIENGLVLCFFKEIENMDITVAKVTVKDRIAYLRGISYPTLFDITKVKETTKEARDYMASEGNELVSASAMLVGSPMLRMMANFYITVNKPKNPTRLFTNLDSAVEWLTQFKR